MLLYHVVIYYFHILVIAVNVHDTHPDLVITSDPYIMIDMIYFLIIGILLLHYCHIIIIIPLSMRFMFILILMYQVSCITLILMLHVILFLFHTLIRSNLYVFAISLDHIDTFPNLKEFLLLSSYQARQVNTVTEYSCHCSTCSY